MATTVIHARARLDDGNETTAGWAAPEDQGWTQAVDVNFRYREKVQNTTAAINNLDVQLQYSLNGAAFTNVSSSSVVVRSSASPNLADAANLTEQLSGGTGTFIGATAFDEVNGICGGTSLDLTSTGKMEVEFCCQLRSADVVRGDTIRLRTINSDTGTAWTTYNVTMTMTAIGANVNVFDSVAAEELISIALYVNSNDTVTVAESITVSLPVSSITTDQNDAVTVYDLTNQEINYWITVTDAITPRLLIQPQPFEAVSIAEAITLTGSLSLNQFDAVAVAEAITLTGKLSLDKFDAVAIAEAITLTGNLSLDQFDAAAIAEDITPRLFILPQPFESVTIVEDITLIFPAASELPVNAFDEVAAAELITLAGNLSLSQFDPAAIVEFITVNFGTVAPLTLDTFDPVTIAEAITPKLLIQPITFDAVAIVEAVTFTGSTSVNQFESVSVAELIELRVFHLFVGTGEDVTAAESITVSMTVVGTLQVNTFDALTLAELGQGLLTKLFITTFDAVTAAEAATIITTIGGINLFDGVAVAELASLQFSRLLIAADEAVSIAEQVNLAFVAPLQIAVGDDVRLLSIPPIDITTLSDIVTVGDDATVTGPLVWASVGSLGSAGSKSANQSTLTLTTTAPFEVGAFAVVLIAVDNFQTTDGDENAITSVVDSAGNVYLEAREFTNGQGAAQGGATISVRYCTAAAQLNTGGTITVSFANATSRDASAITAFKFTSTVAGVVTVAGSAVLANDGSDPGSIDLTLPSGEYLWVRAQAHERPSTDTFTKTVAYGGVFTKNGTTGGTAATNMTVAGEWDLGLVGTSNPSNPAWSSAADEASVLVAFRLDPALAPSMVENVGLMEFVAAFLPKLFINIDDTAVIAEIITLQLGGLISNIPVSVNEPVTLAEVVAAALSRLTIDTNDVVTMAEFISTGAAVQNLSIELGDGVATSENIIFRGRLSIDAFDSVFLLQLAPNAISIVENLTVSDFVSALGPTTVGLNILAFENVVVDIPETGVFESIAVGELAQVVGTGIDWFSIGSLGSISSNSADQSSIVLQTGAIAEVGNVVVLLIAVDNAATTDGDEGAITGVSDGAGNNWVEIGEFCNANAAAQAGATIAAWYSLITTQIPLNALITVGFSNPASRDASALTAWEFGRRQSGAVSVAAVTTLANDTSDPGVMNLALGAGEHLWIRAQAHEGALSDVWIQTINYDGTIDKQGTTGGLAASNMTVVGEFRIFQGASNPSDPSWTAAADEAGMLFALKLSASLAPIASDSVTIAEIATLALARLIISVNDVLIVSEAVTLTQTGNLSVFETVSVTDFSALAVQLTVSAFEFVALAEALAPTLSAYLSVFDSVAVADAVTVPTVAIAINSFDTVTLAEASTVVLPKLVLSAFDNVTPSDVSALFVQGTAPAPPVGEFVNAIDDATVSLDRLTFSIFDTVTVAEAISLSVSVYLSVFDVITTADVVVISLPLTVVGADTVTLVEVALLGSVMSLTAGDDVAVAEQTLISTGAIVVAVQENLTITEAVGGSPALKASAIDTVTLADTAAAFFLVQTIFIEQGDAINAQEEINQEVRGEGALATELVAVDDFADLLIDRLKIEAGEDVAAIEDLTGRLSVYLSLTEDVSVADDAAYIFHGQELFINLGENVTISERLLTNVSLLKIVEVTSEIALELNLQSEVAIDLDLQSEINQDIDLEGEIEL